MSSEKSICPSCYTSRSFPVVLDRCSIVDRELFLQNSPIMQRNFSKGQPCSWVMCGWKHCWSYNGVVIDKPDIFIKSGSSETSFNKQINGVAYNTTKSETTHKTSSIPSTQSHISPIGDSTQPDVWSIGLASTGYIEPETTDDLKKSTSECTDTSSNEITDNITVTNDNPEAFMGNDESKIFENSMCDDGCIVCYDKLSLSAFCILNCKHKICLKCYMSMIKKNECPYCRSKVT